MDKVRIKAGALGKGNPAQDQYWCNYVTSSCKGKPCSCLRYNTNSDCYCPEGSTKTYVPYGTIPGFNRDFFYCCGDPSIGTKYQDVCNEFAKKHGAVWSTTGIVAPQPIPKGAPAQATSGTPGTSTSSPSGSDTNSRSASATSGSASATGASGSATSGSASATGASGSATSGSGNGSGSGSGSGSPVLSSDDPAPVQDPSAPVVTSGNGGTGTLPVSTEPDKADVAEDVSEPNVGEVADVTEDVSEPNVGEVSSKEGTKSELSTGAIIGIILGILAFLAFIFTMFM
jgi:hypothetical protein